MIVSSFHYLSCKIDRIISIGFLARPARLQKGIVSKTIKTWNGPCLSGLTLQNLTPGCKNSFMHLFPSLSVLSLCQLYIQVYIAVFSKCSSASLLTITSDYSKSPIVSFVDKPICPLLHENDVVGRVLTM